MKMINILLLLFVGLMPVAGWSNTQLRLKGTIGKAAVYLEMTEEGTEYYGRYYYKNQLIDIPLKGVVKNGSYILETNYKDVYGVPKTKEYLNFKKSGSKYTGVWKKNGKQLKIAFSPIKPEEFRSARLEKNPVLNDLKLSGIDLFKLDLFKLTGKDSIISDQGLNWRSFTETHTGVEFVRIDSGLPDAKLKYANQYLELLHIRNFLEMLDCSSGGGEPADYGSTYSIEVLSGSLISVSFFNFFFCVGMMHPEEANYAVILDLELKKELTNKDFLSDFAFEENDEEISNFQTNIYRYLSKENPELFDETMSEESEVMGDECEFNRIELWQASMEIHFTNEGLKLLPYFPHVMAPCLEPEWAIIPYAELKGLLKDHYYTLLVESKH